jgi:ATP-dependent DNA helicase RecG
LSTNNLNLYSSIKDLYPRLTSVTQKKYEEAGIKTIFDLIHILPLHVEINPEIKSFDHLVENMLFKGKAKILNIQAYPAFRRFGKGRVQLFNMTVIVQDTFSSKTLTLKWFNAYPNLPKKLKSIEEMIFIGKVQNFKGVLQIINPEILDNEEEFNSQSFIIKYPTINSLTSKNTESLLNKVPKNLWNEISEKLPQEILAKRKLKNLANSLQILHAKTDIDTYKNEFKNALKRLIYEDFFNDQIKIYIRREFTKKKVAKKFNLAEKSINETLKLFPYKFTPDQKKALDEIQSDLISGHPMMRLIQGDVGCGKTSVSFVASMIITENNAQVALMCPTEALAIQHFHTFKSIHPNNEKIDLLLGSHKASEKKEILKKVKSGETTILIGTHSLIQDSVSFKNLQLVIIDEQHKFGVDQRLKLIGKGENVHSLIMTATPIPRTLQLARFGDLDISNIKTMPIGRKPIQTRIVTKDTYDKYLSFIKTRLTLGEQIYIVVPAIEENEQLDINNINELSQTYQKYFPEYQIEVLHGKLKSVEKNKSLENFKNKKSQILIATSVIEVGIDNPNATVMSIYNPERFGLSSLHQLRGRVGRGNKPGFCFLVTLNEISATSKERLQVLEKNLDGFIIAEADLRFRGEGDLFGVNQSGTADSNRIASVFQHPEIFEEAHNDFQELKMTSPQILEKLVQKFQTDAKIQVTA